MTEKGKFTELLNAAQYEKTKERKEEETKERKEELKKSLPEATSEAISEEDPIVNLNLKVPRSVRERITISARELHMSNKDLIIKAVADYVERTNSLKKK